MYLYEINECQISGGKTRRDSGHNPAEVCTDPRQRTKEEILRYSTFRFSWNSLRLNNIINLFF